MKEHDEVIEAAGGLVWREEPDGKKIAIIHRTRYGDEWTLPKGKMKKGETLLEAAKREVCEEIGLRNPKIGSYAGNISYTVEGKPKIVHFWNMVVEEEWKFGKTKEVDRIRWLPIPEALKILDHPKERALLNNVLTKKLGV